MRNFGKTVAQLRWSRRFSRADVAQHSGLSDKEVAYIEWGLLLLGDVSDRVPQLALGLDISANSLSRILSTILASAERPTVL